MPILHKIIHAILIGIAIFLLLITTLTIIYRFSFVHPYSTLMIRDSLTGVSYQRKWVSLDEINLTLVKSVMVSEDSRFCSHYGIDWSALRYAILTHNDEAQAGASTITMQVVKNLYLWGSRSYIRKIIEIPLSLWIDLLLPKKRIMEIYLNIAEWGNGIYGIEAAAQHYFGVSAKQLSARQSALLTVALPSPQTRDPRFYGYRLFAHAVVIQQRASNSSSYTGCIRN